jgi:glycosyltransferase involved in cell wall biosynthesis
MLVSVIIPCYNVENFIAECLNSVLNQTHKEIEIICVDDGSTDKTLEILSQYAQRHAGKIQIIKQSNSGAPAARNNGLKIAKGEYIQFLDADDLLMDSKIDHQLMLVEYEEQKVDFIVGNCFWKKIDGKLIIWHKFRYNKWIDLMNGTLGDTCSNLWRRDFLLEVGGWDIEMKSSQEFHLLFKCIKSNGIYVYDEQPLTITREREKISISKKHISGNIYRYIYARLEVKQYLEEKNIFDSEIAEEFYFILHSKLLLFYNINKKESLLLYEKFFSNYSVLKIKKINFLKKIVCFLFGLKGGVFLNYFISQLKRVI